jgi:hypothetical protein
MDAKEKAPEEKLQDPNTKLQRNPKTKLQGQSLDHSHSDGDLLGLESWNFSGAWNLELGSLLSLRLKACARSGRC